MCNVEYTYVVRSQDPHFELLSSKQFDVDRTQRFALATFTLFSSELQDIIVLKKGAKFQNEERALELSICMASKVMRRQQK